MKIRRRLVGPGDDTRGQWGIRRKPFVFGQLILDLPELRYEIGLKFRLLRGRDAGKTVVADAAAELELREQVGGIIETS